MNTRHQRSSYVHKFLALFLAFTVLLPCVTPYNTILANNNGPNAPEAASFEPVDATDMVNLSNGSFTYVLPLLNVPSPEGGYPIALSYHAGIAMEQEASWVGLGWTLNPGAINRGVNGYPDDWGNVTLNDFFYDKGWSNDYYSFGVGAGFSGGFSVGLGLSWGSNQSLGGSVSAGYQFQGGSIGFSVGSNGGGFNASLRNVSVSASTANGVSAGVGYGNTSVGISKNGVNIRTGVGSLKGSLNYSYSSGFSGSISSNGVSVGVSNKGKFSFNALGISFSSNGASISVGGAGVSYSSNSSSSGDYDVNSVTKGFHIPIKLFYIKFSHTKVRYSLFKPDYNYVSGMLNPVAANELGSEQYYDDEEKIIIQARDLKKNVSMDVNEIYKYDSKMYEGELLDYQDQISQNNLVVPNYDNYVVNAQGLSGAISPFMKYSLNLSIRGKEESDDDLESTSLNYSYSEYKAAMTDHYRIPHGGSFTRKIDFTFDSYYNSFFRLNKTDIEERDLTANDFLFNDRIVQSFSISDTETYTKDFDKREGNFIKTYTNKEISDSYVNGASTLSGFIDAREYDHEKDNESRITRSNEDLFPEDGIGAYTITTPDGKTYHYSLPVYNFETVYKNYKDENDENENFLELEKQTPYATHWLLTAITGPDYIGRTPGEINQNDYGYWVEFDYGKWSDGYGWKTPNGDPNEEINDEDEDDITYSYSWGRKQIYYLDAVKTRTHTALFVKNLREDNQSVEIEDYESKATYNASSLTVTNFDLEDNSTALTVDKTNAFMVSSTEDTEMYRADGTSTFLDFYTYGYLYKKTRRVYRDIPKTYSLKLKKIILLDNDNYSYQSSIKNNGNQFIPLETGMVTESFYGIDDIRYNIDGRDYKEDLLFWEKFTNDNARVFNSHLCYNIIDSTDIDDDLEEKASEIIELEQDYSLVYGAPNTSSGRLTLNKVNFKGKKGVQLVPPYEFAYENSADYNSEYEDDWGYYDYGVDQWSLNEITTPTGGKIEIEYEEDFYTYEAASYRDISYDQITFSKDGEYVEVIFDNPNIVLENYFIEGKNAEISFKLSDVYTFVNRNLIRNERNITTYLKVESMNNNVLTLSLTDKTEGLDSESIVSNPFYVVGDSKTTRDCEYLGVGSCYKDIVIKNNYDSVSVTNSAELQGGGIRTEKITVNDGINDVGSTVYEYNEGVTSYVPTDDPKGIPYASELPAPMVMYKEVEMKNYDGAANFLGKTVYNFETLDVAREEPGYIFSLGKNFRVKENQNEIFQNGRVVANKYTIESNLTSLGRVNSVEVYNSKNQLLSSVQNNYKEDLDENLEIGVTEETHSSYKLVNEDDEETYYVGSTSKVNYPSVLESITETASGFSMTKSFDKYDFLTGKVLETSTYNSDGMAFKTETVPAYAKYSNMGSKIDNEDNKNMLTQTAGSYSYIYKDNAWKAIGANITTWNNEWEYTDALGGRYGLDSPNNENEKIWRKHKTFVFNGPKEGDGTFTSINDFDYTLNATNTNWKQLSETTLYNRFSKTLEVKDINGNCAATKMDNRNEKVIATANAGQFEMFYGSAEYDSYSAVVAVQGGVSLVGIKNDHVADKYTTNNNAHTGTYSLEVDNTNVYFEAFLSSDPDRHRGGRYKVSVWVDKGNEDKARVVVNGKVIPFNGEKIYAGNWVLLNHYERLLSSTEYKIGIQSTSGTILADDFRLHPIASSMTSYVYNEWDEVSYIIGANGLATHYKYDSAGRLIETWAEVIDKNQILGDGRGGFKQVSKNSYNYKNQ